MSYHRAPNARPLRPGQRVCPTCCGAGSHPGHYFDSGAYWLCPTCDCRGWVSVPLLKRVAGKAVALALLFGWRAWVWGALRLDRLERWWGRP